MKRLLDLSNVPTPQLKEIRKVLVAGVQAVAEDTNKPDMSGVAQLCHKSPPKGYPDDKSEYGDPECYRYPLNTKARCLTAWRYVHQADNKEILGDKFKGVESKIKSYAKKHYDLDLQVGESDKFNWEQAFLEYYDAETMGERCDSVELEPEGATNEGDDNIMEDIEKKVASLEQEVEDLKKTKDTLETENASLKEQASQVETLTTEINEMKTELEALRKFKTDTEEAQERADNIKAIKSKLDEAGIEADVEAEADYWLSMTDDNLVKTIAKLSELSKGAKASASIKVPPVKTDDEDDDNVSIVSQALNERKQAKND